MAAEASSFVSTGATLPVGSRILFDTIDLGGSTGKVEVVRIGAALAGSTDLVSTSLPFPVSVHTSTGVVTIAGNSTAIISTASVIRIQSTASLSVAADALTTASKIQVELVGQASVTAGAAFPVTDNAQSLTVDFAEGNASVSAILSTVGMGGSSGKPMFVTALQGQFNAQSTFASTTITSTTAWTAFSSAASTRFVITDVEIMNQGGTIVLVSIFDGSTSGTVIDRTYCATAGGGKSAHYITPLFNTTGNPITVQQDAGSTITVNLRGYRSS